MLGRRAHLLATAEVAERVEAMAREAVVRRSPLYAEVPVLRKDGSERLCEAAVVALEDESGRVTAMAAIGRDITERRRSERSLKEALSRLKELESIINRSPAVVFLWRAAEGWPVEFVSENVRQFGYTAEDFTSGRISWPGVTHPDDVPRLEAELRNYRERGMHQFVQRYRLMTKWGDIRSIEDRTIALPNPDGTIGFYQGIILDVTERTLVEDALRREKDFVESLIDTAPAIVIVLDTAGRVIRSNPYWEQVTGYRFEEVQGKDPFALLLRPDDQSSLRRLSAQILAGEDGSVFATQIVSRSSGLREVEWNSRLLRNNEGHVVGALLIGRDVTDLRQAQERALQAERLAAIGQMVTGLAHESGNALQRSQACLEMLALAVQDRPAAIDLVNRIQSAQDRLQQLNEEVRQYAAPVVLRRQWCYLPDLIDEAWGDLEPVHRGRVVRLEVPPPRNGGPCLVDRYAVERVFRNILDNSLAACADPVHIQVRCEEARLDGRPAIEVRLRDNGPGLNRDQREKIFEPFYTTKTQGTGLGMAISKRIVEAHNGRIAVGDTDGTGAELIVTLPKE
jgi:PAS domain S-box-containing protein